MSDGDFDAMALEVDLSVKTGNDLLDDYFKDNFAPDTGQWIHAHPELAGIENIYEKRYK